MKKILCVMIALLVLVCGYAIAEGNACCDNPSRTVSDKAPTCTENGYSNEVCKNCNYVYENIVIKATGHNWKSNGIVTPAKNCLSNDIEALECTVCGATDTKTGSKGLHSYKTIVHKATCTTDGYNEEKCELCGDVNETWPTGSKTGHTFESKCVSEATCTSAAYYEERCIYCDTLNDSWYKGDKLPHTPKAVAAVAPTCTTTGLTEGSECEFCKVTLKAQDVVAALGHDMKKNVTAATCTTAEYTDEYCTRCSHTVAAYKTGDALGHDWYKRVIAPTETSRGYTEWSCTRGCGEWMRTDYTAKLVAEAVVVDVALNPYGSIVTDLEDNDKPYTAEIDEEAKRVYIIAKAEADGSFPLRELHLDLALIAELKEDGIVDVCFVVGDAEIVVPFASFEGEIMETVKADFPATLTGYVVTLDVNAVNAEGVAGCLVKVDMSADTEEADGIEMEITDVMTGMSLLLGETPITVVGGGVYTA